MDKTVTWRFFNIAKDNARTPPLADLMEGLLKLKKKDRTVEIIPYYKMRLENFSSHDSERYVGEFVRIQETNFPSEVTDDNVLPLGVNNPLGHSICFGWNKTKSVMCIQQEPRIISLGRILEYLFCFGTNNSYAASSIVRKDAWKRLNKGDLRKVEIAIAQPEDIDAVNADGEAAISAFKKLAAAYDAPLIRITASMGHRKGGLSGKLQNAMRALVDSSADVRAAKATVSAGGEVETLDLIQELLSERAELGLPDNDPHKSFQVRSAVAITTMKKHGY